MHQHVHHFHYHRFHIAEEAGNATAWLPRVGNRESDQQGEHNDLQHLAIRHGTHRVGGENIHQHISKGRRRQGLVLNVHAEIKLGAGTHEYREQQRRGYSHRGGQQVKGQRLARDRTHARAVAQRTASADE